AELLETVTARAFEDHLVAMAASGLIDNPGNLKSVHRDETVDVLVIAEQRFHAAQVAEFLLAHRTDDHDVAYLLNFVRAEHRDHGYQHREATGIIADPGRANDTIFLFHRYVRAVREYGVEVCGDHELRLADASGPQRDDIALGVDRSIFETDVLKSS